MTSPLPPRRPANPLALPRPPLLPPATPSRAAIALASRAAAGRFALQRCAECGAVQYPPREACHACLGTGLRWQDVPNGGELLAQTTIRATADPYFRARLPWRTGLVRLDCGPSVVAHLHGDTTIGRVRMALRLDKSGQAVMLALPDQDTPHMHDDPLLREMNADPRGRRILVTHGAAPFGQAMARALLEAGAAQVFAGIAEEWRPAPAPIGDPVPLDLTDAQSVARLAAGFGGRIDMVIHTGPHLRPGGIIDRRDTVTAREEMEAAYLGPMRLAQALGPALRARGGDGTHPACAWVLPVSIAALAPTPGYAATAPAQAAALSLATALRAELRPIRVITALLGPLDDEWHQAVPPPKVTPQAFAAGILRALRTGIEEIAIGDVAQDALRRWQDDPSTLARELAAG